MGNAAWLRSFVAVIALAVTAGCTTRSAISTAADLHPTAAPSAAPADSAPADPTTVTIVAGGDVLPHENVYGAAKQPSGEYDFTGLFSGITPFIAAADLALCAMEVPVAPPGEKPSAFPAFGVPAGIATSLKAGGWDGCSTATNHSMDRGFAGITATIDAFSAAGLGWAGTARTDAEAAQIQLYVIDTPTRDLTVAHLSATTLTNGYVAPKDKPWAWNVVGDLGHRSVDDVIADAARARQLGADIVIVSMHWGTEYVSAPIEQQTEIGDQLAASGQVDLILGSHSHTPQPVQMLGGGPGGRGTWVVWSMGNMISGQTISLFGYRITTGLLVTAQVEVPPGAPAYVAGLQWTAVTGEMPHGSAIYLLDELATGVRSSPLSATEIAARENATYPVMSADGSIQRTDYPYGDGEIAAAPRA